MNRIGHPLIHLSTTTSTMDDVARLADEGAPEGLVVVADEQTAGRGRAGRSWASPAGAGLYCSILLRPRVPPARLTILPLLAGVAVAEAIEDVAPVICQLKWPNDVWVGDRKIAGLLTTAKATPDGARQVILGVGVNLTGAVADLPPGATSIRALTGAAPPPSVLLLALIERLNDRLPALFVRPGMPDLDAWRRRAAFLGEAVTVVDAGETVVGVMRGIDDSGALLLDSDCVLRRVLAGDLIRGPRPKIARS